MDNAVPNVAIKIESGGVCERILSLCEEFPRGLSDKVLQNDMPNIDPKVRASAINQLLNSGKIDLFKSNESGGLLYRLKNPSKAATIRGDQEEHIVYKIIEEAGNKGTWIRDIRIKSNLVQIQLNKVLRALITKKHIKEVKSVNATRKKVYMLYDLEPDPSVTGGAWYTEQDFESEFVEVLNQQCYRYLYDKLEKSRESQEGPLAARNLSLSTSGEVLNFISDLGISKIQLKQEDIESILNTLVFDRKVEKSTSTKNGDEIKLYRAIETLLPTTGLVKIPCGVCPVANRCSDIGSITPCKCTYITEWMN